MVFKGFKAVCGAGVACKDNDKVVEWCIAVLLVRLFVVMIGWFVVVVIGWWSWELKERSHVLYHNRNRRLYERVLTDKHSLIIHKTAYSILIIITIYQDKKIG